MALQGTLETFSVPEVLRLLSGTRKTGLLALTGDRGAGNVWMVDGTIVGASSDHEAEGDVEAVLFDLLRFAEGSFVFETDAPFEGSEPQEIDVEKALVRAEQLMDDWREIESVVPSLRVWVSMVPSLATDSVTVTSDQWASLAVIGRGTSGHRLDDELRLGELEASRRIRDLVVAGLVEVDTSTVEHDEVDETHEVATQLDDAPEPDVDATWTREDDLSVGLAGFVARGDDQEAHPDVSDETHGDVEVVSYADEEVEVDVDVDLAGEPHDDDVVLPDLGFDELDGVEAEVEGADDAAPEVAAEPVAAGDDDDEPIEADAAAAASTADVDGDAEPDEFLSQLANLSPKAAAAIEATASESEATRTRAAGEADEEINRNLLLKFLSSSKP